MSDQIDEFESMFRAADRKPYLYDEITLDLITLVTDGTEEEADDLRTSVLAFLPCLFGVEWRIVIMSPGDSVADLLAHLQQEPPSLIVTRRHINEKELLPQHSLGVYLDLLTQATPHPVLVLPGSAANPGSLPEEEGCKNVMVVTDHISGNHKLINWGAFCSLNDGDLFLAHVEDDVTFSRYMQIISEIPEIPTESTRKLLDARLLKDAADFIETGKAELVKHRPELTVHSLVQRGHRLRQYVELVDEHSVDLLVMNTREEDQLAMHGLAYSISVEMQDRALLLL